MLVALIVMLVYYMDTVDTTSGSAVASRLSRASSKSRSLSMDGSRRTNNISRGSTLATSRGGRRPAVASGGSSVLNRGRRGITVVAVVTPRAIPTNRRFPIGMAVASDGKGPLGKAAVVCGRNSKMSYGMIGKGTAFGCEVGGPGAAVGLAAAVCNVRNVSFCASVPKCKGREAVRTAVASKGCGARVCMGKAGVARKRGTAVRVGTARKSKLLISLPMAVGVGDRGVAEAAGGRN